MKTEVPVKQAHRLINTGCVVLITSAFEKNTNIMSLAWQTPLSGDPVLIGIAVARAHYTHELILQSGEFAVNVPGWELLEQVKYCGKTKGRDKDKFAGSQLTALPAAVIKTPLINECLAHIECKVAESVLTGDHTFFVGEVLTAAACKEQFNGYWQPGTKLIHHLGGTNYYHRRT